MLADLLQDRATLFATGTMPASERDAFEVLLAYHGELRDLVAGLQEVTAKLALADADAATPPQALRDRILRELPSLPPLEPESFVVTDPAGCIEWVNPAFTAMCGYTLDELRGRKPGTLLQGPGTDPAGVERIRTALRLRLPCRETLVNYHKDGSRYRADVRIAPILDDVGEPLWLVARERKLPD